MAGTVGLGVGSFVGEGVITVGVLTPPVPVEGEGGTDQRNPLLLLLQSKLAGGSALKAQTFSRIQSYCEDILL